MLAKSPNHLAKMSKFVKTVQEQAVFHFSTESMDGLLHKIQMYIGIKNN